MNTTFNRSSVFAATAAAVQSSMTNTLVRSIGLCQLVLNGDITEEETLQLVNLSEKPATDNKLAYEQYKYAGRLVRQAREVLDTEQGFKDQLLSVDINNSQALETFQVQQAIKGHYLTTAESFNRLVSSKLTEEAKAARAEKAKKLEGKKAQKQPKAPTATATAPMAQATVAAIQTHLTAEDELAAGMIADLIAADDIISQTLKAINKQAPTIQDIQRIAEAWAADRAALLAEMAELKAAKDRATAPRQRRAA